jgi:hypothetical protein
MLHLTKQEQLVLGVIVALLIMGMFVKVCRTAHPPAQPKTLVKP